MGLLLGAWTGWRLWFRPSPEARIWRRQAAIQRRRRSAAGGPTGTLRGLRSQTQAVADVLDGWVSVPVRPLLCVHGPWPARASRLFSRVRVAPLRQLADVLSAGPATRPDAVELASARLLAVFRPAA